MECTKNYVICLLYMILEHLNSNGSILTSNSMVDEILGSLSTRPSLVFINVTAQLPLELTPNNYTSWRPQVQSLLQVYINGDTPKPSSTITQGGVQITNPNHVRWIQQVQLLLSSICASLLELLLAYNALISPS